MSVYQVRTFGEILSTIREEMQFSSSDTTKLNRIRRDVNTILQEIAADKNWWWLQGNVSLQLPAYISAGTAALTAGSSTVTLTVAPAASMTGYWFASEGYQEIYRVESHTAGATTLKLDGLFTGTANATASYKLWKDRIPLPTDCKETLDVYHDHHALTLDAKGLQEFRRLVALSPRAEGKPRYYFTGDFVDPSQTSAITSLPAVSTRASSGPIKTLVFASGLPSSITTANTAGDPIRIRIAKAGDPSYNGDVLVSMVTTTSVANDTILYTGKGELQESATSDSSISVTQLDQEAEYDRYRELFLYPCLNLSRMTLHVDYIKQVLPLSNDNDEPVIPIEDRMVLVYGALARAWSRDRQPEEAARNFNLYQGKLAKMAGKLQDSQEAPRFAVSKDYLRGKRNISMRGGLGGGYAPVGSGGASSSVVTGLANTVATFDSSGELQGSTTVSTTELGYLDGVTSAVQTQLDAITTLANGKIYIGNASNVAAEVTPSGDVTMDNTGVNAIATGVIVDADVSASAGLTRSKTASGTAYRLVANNSSGVMAENAAITASRALASDANGQPVAATTTATELGYVNGVTSAIQTQINTKAPSASPTFTGTVTTPLTASRAVATGASSELAASATTATELGYVNGVTSAIQTQINTKAPSASPTFTGTVTTPVTASRALVTGASSELAAATTTATEIGYVNGVTSAIQTQLDAKTLKSTLTTKGDLYVATASATIARQAVGTDAQTVIADSAQTNGIKWGTLQLGGGGTGATTKAGAFDALQPMTTSGDVIYGGASGTGTRLAKGSDGQVLTLASGLPSWASNTPGNYSVTSVQTNTYSILTTDNVVLLSGASNAYTATLPTAVGVTGKIYLIKRTDLTLANVVTIGTTSSQTIDGVTTRKLCTQYEQFTVISDGANWQILDHSYPQGWVAYTPTFTGFGTAASVEIYSRRVGDSLEISGNVTTGTVTGTEARMTLGYGGTNANVTSAAITSIRQAGFRSDAAGAASYDGTLIEPSIGYITFGTQKAGTGMLTKQLANAIFNNATKQTLYALVPITGWEA